MLKSNSHFPCNGSNMNLGFTIATDQIQSISRNKISLLLLKTASFILKVAPYSLCSASFNRSTVWLMLL